MFIPELEALPIKILKKEEYFVFSLFLEEFKSVIRITKFQF